MGIASPAANGRLDIPSPGISLVSVARAWDKWLPTSLVVSGLSDAAEGESCC